MADAISDCGRLSWPEQLYITCPYGCLLTEGRLGGGGNSRVVNTCSATWFDLEVRSSNFPVVCTVTVYQNASTSFQSALTGASQPSQEMGSEDKRYTAPCPGRGEPAQSEAGTETRWHSTCPAPGNQSPFPGHLEEGGGWRSSWFSEYAPGWS